MRPLYIAIDSDALINFARIYYGNGKVQLTPNTKQRIKEFLDDIKSNDISVRFVVPSVVFNEVHNPQMKNSEIDMFIKNFCCIPKIMPKELNYAKKVETLAKSYCDVKPDGSLAPMKQIYSAASGAYVPSNDAYIMAEATTLGMSLITFNEQDYVSANKNKLNDRSRAYEIVNINKSYNCRYIAYSESTKKDYLRPNDVMEFINLLYGRKFLHFPAPKIKYARAGSVEFNDGFLLK